MISNIENNSLEGNKPPVQNNGIFFQNNILNKVFIDVEQRLALLLIYIWHQRASQACAIKPLCSFVIPYCFDGAWRWWFKICIYFWSLKIFRLIAILYLLVILTSVQYLQFMPESAIRILFMAVKRFIQCVHEDKDKLMPEKETIYCKQKKSQWPGTMNFSWVKQSCMSKKSNLKQCNNPTISTYQNERKRESK